MTVVLPLNKLTIVIALFCFAQGCLAQNESSDSLTADQNRAWLASVAEAEPQLKFALVKDRLISRYQIEEARERNIPLLILDGKPMAVDLSDTERNFLMTHLTPQNAQIDVVVKEPEGLYINKTFAGIILVKFTDKRIGRKFRKIGP
jgi:hypothetical protein